MRKLSLDVLEINRLESNRFGIVAAKVTDATASVEVIAAEAKSKGVQMLTIRVDVSDLPRVHALEAAGYQLMDTLVYYRRGLIEVPPTRPLANGLTIRQATPQDAKPVEKLAREAFTGYFGHYHADPRLSNAAADQAYVEWAGTSTARVSPEAPVLLAEILGTIAGFLTLKRNSPGEMELILSSVDPVHKGSGLYTALIAASLLLSREMGADSIITSTQINNYTVQRVWSQLGFLHSKSLYTLHKWF